MQFIDGENEKDAGSDVEGTTSEGDISNELNEMKISNSASMPLLQQVSLRTS